MLASAPSIVSEKIQFFLPATTERMEFSLMLLERLHLPSSKYVMRIKYIRRYLERPIIAISRIDAYNGDTVTFYIQYFESSTLIHSECDTFNFQRTGLKRVAYIENAPHGAISKIFLDCWGSRM